MVLPGTTYLWLATIIISDEGSTSMSLISMILLVLIAGICGAVGQSIAGYSRGGCLASVAVGFIGAMLGMWVARMVGMHELFAVRIGSQSFPIIWSIIGSALFVALISFISKQR